LKRAGYSGRVFVALARVARAQFSFALPGFYACLCTALFLSPQAALFYLLVFFFFFFMVDLGATTQNAELEDSSGHLRVSRIQFLILDPF